ncbi:MAG: phosphate transport system regulatory protein PhoU [Planctomycetota bacterium]|nr:MAG: phosphate transport system regulatory protein PhoU [Planctomycetota bacterium]
MTVHMVRELMTLHRNILSMCAMVEEIVTQAVDELSEPNVDKAEALARRDDEIDQWDVNIEEECLKLLALYQPVAGDLRRITTVLKLSNELERIADLGVHIAERAADLALHPPILVPPKLKQMAKIALEMVHRSIDSYVQEDAQLARDVCATDDRVDQLNREIIEELIGIMRQSPENIEPALHMFSASRHVERIADHATNIAEDVVYLVEGEIIRHRPVRRADTGSGPVPPSRR